MLNQYADMYLIYGETGKIGDRASKMYIERFSNGSNLSIKCLHVFIKNCAELDGLLKLVIIDQATNRHGQSRSRKLSYSRLKNNKVSQHKLLTVGLVFRTQQCSGY